MHHHKSNVLWGLGFLLLHLQFTVWDCEADEFNNLTVASTTLQNFLLVSIAIGYLLETKETSGRQCLNKIQWAILENIYVN